MTEFSTLLQQGNAWLFVPSAILLGALHGLEPGHSKTMMAAFIVAIRGTIAQAVLLGLSATLSHTTIVWVIAMAGLYFGQGWNAETTEPYFQVASAVLIIGVAAWMMWRKKEKLWVFIYFILLLVPIFLFMSIKGTPFKISALIHLFPLVLLYFALKPIWAGMKQ